MLIRGIDVSKYQGDAIDWQRVRAAGIDRVYVKLTEGARGPNSINDLGREQWRGAADEGFDVGGYHYLSPSSEPEDQAELFLNVLTATAVDGPMLAPALDLERAGQHDRPEEIAARALAWLEHVKRSIGVMPVVYTYPAFAQQHLGGAEARALGEYPLWIAHYLPAQKIVEGPSVPPPWTTWAGWQHTGKGQVPGIRGAVDLDCWRA